MNKGKITGIVVLVILLVCLVRIQQAYAVGHERNMPVPPVSGLIESVSNPTGNCLNLGLKGWYGTVTISLNRLWIYVRDANPNSTFIVWIGYVQAGGVCNGTWKAVGSVSTDQSGEGTSVQWLSPSSAYTYFVFELRDTSGNVVYATNALAS